MPWGNLNGLNNGSNGEIPGQLNSLAIAAGIAVLQDQSFRQQTLDWLPASRSQLMGRID